MACKFQATIDWKFAPIIGLRDDEMFRETIITTYNITVADTASDISKFSLEVLYDNNAK